MLHTCKQTVAIHNIGAIYDSPKEHLFFLQQRNLTAATRHEASLLKQSLGHSQQEENSLETSLAEIKQRLAHKQDENNKLISQIQEQQLACAKEAEKIQVS